MVNLTIGILLSDWISCSLNKTRLSFSIACLQESHQRHLLQIITLLLVLCVFNFEPPPTLIPRGAKRSNFIPYFGIIQRSLTFFMNPSFWRLPRDASGATVMLAPDLTADNGFHEWRWKRRSSPSQCEQTHLIKAGNYTCEKWCSISVVCSSGDVQTWRRQLAQITASESPRSQRADRTDRCEGEKGRKERDRGRSGPTQWMR